MSTIPQIIKESRAMMDKSLESSKKELASIRTGKATTSLLDTVRVDVYGQTMPLNQVASISAPEPRLLTVTPWDKGQIQIIERALRDSDLGLNPASQGGTIRVPLPALNQERRKELVKVVHKLAEEARIGIRHARTEGRERLKKLERTSEDDIKHGEKDLQKLHDDFIARIDDLLKGKEAEILEV
ncbi:MAG: ribosome recycling factor [Gemmatimonadaceae bacterium]|nr:ribosome recycling factor [Gemmatimonadaceae bacterium]MDQ3242623.1 ribosome recycling factor [Gemmatimonadota bacterium]